MTLALGISAFVLTAVAAVSIYVAAKRAAADIAAQFVEVVVLFNVRQRVALPTTCSLERFKECAFEAADLCVGLFGPRALDALNDVRVTVDFGLRWHDAITGQLVAGTSRHGDVRVGCDLAALAHEFIHVCQERIDGHIDEAHAFWLPDYDKAIATYHSRMGIPA